MKNLILKCLCCVSPFFADAQTNVTPDLSQNLDKVNFRFLDKFRADTTKNAVFYSPYSLWSAFAMLSEGAQGTTAQELQTALSLPSDAKTRQNYFSALQKSLNSNEKSIIRTNNAIWVQKDFPIKKTFHNDIIKYYGARSENLDFRTPTKQEESRQKINAWVEDKTNKLIKDAMPSGSINDKTALVLTNTIYFKGKFTNPFNQKLTENQNFTNFDKTISNVPMMRHDGKEQLKYFENSKVQLLELPYEGGVSLWVVLPHKQGFDDLSNFTAEQLNEWQNKASIADVVAFMPKFKLETSYDMIPTLQQLGIYQVFTEYANLRGIADTTLNVTGVIHKAYISVSEEATEAAAFTGIVVGVVESAMPKKPKIFRVDRPFMFFIQDTKNKVTLFSGVVNKL